jgi:signal transduction histidine kinase
MRDKLTGDGRPGTEEKSPFEGGAEVPDGTEVGDDSSLSYHPKLTVRTRSENGQILIEVQDNGPGIPDEIKDKILQPFFTTKKGTAGTGLGLSITNDIVKAHGGMLHVSSSHEGSCFTIQLQKQFL